MTQNNNEKTGRPLRRASTGKIIIYVISMQKREKLKHQLIKIKSELKLIILRNLKRYSHTTIQIKAKESHNKCR